MDINKLRKYEYIVFGFEHYNPLGIVRSLGEVGIYPIGVIVKNKRKITSASKYFKEIHMVDTVEDGYELILKLYGNNATKAGYINTYILTSDDTMTSYLDNRYNQIKDKFIFYNAGEEGRITKYMDKGLLSELAVKYGLNIPKTYVVKKGSIPEGIVYPVITKAKDSVQYGWKENVFICNSEDELKDALSKVTQEEVLVQQYIKKKNELCIDGLCVNKGQDVFLTMESTYNYLLPNSYSFTFTLKNSNNKKIQNALVKMMSEIGFEGIFTIEFLIDEKDELYFIEINFRHSAWGYASTCLGMNLITNWANGMIYKKIESDIYKEIPNDYVAMVELPDFKNRVIKNHMNLFKWYKEMRACKCLYYYNKDDPKPFWSALVSIISR